MISTTRSIFVVFSILQCGIVISTASTSSTNDSSISVAELIEELRRESMEPRLVHAFYLFVAESCGDRLYDLSKNVSAECSTITKATRLMYEKLAISLQVNLAMNYALVIVSEDVTNTSSLEEHPLESFCRAIALRFAENTTLSDAFERTKNEAAKLHPVSGRPPYYSQLLKVNSAEEISLKIINMSTVAELARFMAAWSFPTVSSSRVLKSPRYLFAEACEAVAQEETFAESMQGVFDKVMNETMAVIVVENSLEKWNPYSRPGDAWFMPKMMKTLYSQVASDAILMKEVERMAAIIGKNKNASPEDLDFSKI